MEKTVDDHCWERRCALIYKVRLTILYHLMRERFFDQMDKAISIVTALAATSAVGSLIGQGGGVAEVAAVVTAMLSLIPLVFSPAGAAKRHGQIAGEFRKLRAEFERAGEHWTESVCDEMAARTIELESQEPAALCALVAYCQNQLNIGSDGAVINLTWYHKLLMHFISFDAATLRMQDAAGDR